MTALTAVQAVNAVMADVGAVAKDSQSRAGGNYRYRGIDDVINALAGPMRVHGLVLCPHVVECEVVPMLNRDGWTETRLIVEYDVVGPDGSTLPRPVRAFAIGADNGDKGPGKALSYAYKAAISQLFCIPTDDPAMNNEHAVIPDAVPKVDAEQIATIGELFNSIEDEELRKRAKVDFANQISIADPGTGELVRVALREVPAHLFGTIYDEATHFVRSLVVHDVANDEEQCPGL